MQHFSAIPTLIKIIEDCTQEAVVRHEAAEALAAFRDPKFIEVLRRFTSSECVELAETCKIAVDYLKWISDLQSDQEKSSVSVFGTLDPAPPLDNKIDNAAGLDEIARIFMDTNQPLFSRYRAMFSLRNIGTREAVEVLIEGFKDSSALFKHEIAFVFGQLQSEYAVQSLMNVLRDDTEHPMVRHEAAEALGAIASRKEIYTLLKEFSASHHPRIIRESCHVALDMYEYGKSEEFEYTLNHFS
ncbi:deoxyhypusine hydroxylase-like [Zophobas morio]|uniref:deoxyhypusine hydroxylase-like n=1 Tax=Zophobas morio TaxID=2755281 RepID=UPI0030837CF7